MWEEYIKYYEKNYHIIVPILSGHNPKNKEEFVSFKECAKEIEDYFIFNYGNDVYAIYGMSMGGVLTATIWENKRLNIEKVIIDTKNTKIYYYHGTKTNEMFAKKTAKYIKKKYPNSNIICFKGKGHCENSLLNPNEMIKELDKVL